MGKFKTELHAHCRGVSTCAHADEDTLIEKYLAAGYSSVVLTNHMNIHTFHSMQDACWEEKTRYFLDGYTVLKQKAKGKLDILLGLELRFTDCGNDYLVYGADEDFILMYPDLLTMGLHTFSAIAKEKGALLFQAHPFRFGMTVVNPNYFDGIEVFNGHKGQNSNNAVANFWAETHGMRKISGSDFHNPDSQIAGGILTDMKITRIAQLKEVLLSGRYELIRQE